MGSEIMESLSKLGWGEDASDAMRFYYAVARVKSIRENNEEKTPGRPWWEWYESFRLHRGAQQGIQVAYPPVETNGQKQLFDRLITSIPSSLCEFIQVALPGRVKNEKFYDLLEKQYDKLLHQCYCVYLLLSIQADAPLDAAYNQYLKLFAGKDKPLEEAAFQRLFCLMNWQEIRDDTSIMAAAKEANELLTRMIVTNREKCRIMAEIVHHLPKLKQKSMNAPQAYLSKILYDDSKTFSAVAAAREINVLVEQMPKSLTFMDFLTALMGTEGKSKNLAELGFLLPWLKNLWDDKPETPVCLVNASPPFMTAWGLRSCDSVTVPYDTAKKPVSEALDASVYDMTELKSILYAKEQRILYFSRGFREEEIRKHLLDLCRENAVVVAVLADSYKAVTTSLPGYGAESLAILPESLYRSGPAKNFVVKLIPKQVDQILARDVEVRAIDRRYYLEPEPCWAAVLLPASDYATNQPLRTLFKQTLNKNEFAQKRTRPKAYVFSPELTLWYRAKAIPGDKREVCLYLCEPPTEQQRKRNKYPRGKIIKSTETWATSIQPEEIEPWIEEKGAFNGKLRSKAVEQITLYTNKMISLKSLWYMLYDQLNIRGPEMQLLSRFAQSEHGADLIIGHASEEEIETAIQKDGANQDELVPLLDNLFDLALRRRLIKTHPFEELHDARKLKKKREESIRKLAKRNYSVEEERRIWSYFRMNQNEKGAIGMILCFLTGLTPPYVAALTWRDWRRITYTEHKQLIVNKRLRPDGSIEWQTAEENCRLVPVMDQLTHILDEYQKQQNAQPDDRIIDLDDALAAIRKQIRAAEKNAGIEEDRISIPDSDMELDLNRYEGSRMRSNFEWHCYMDCGMTDAEVHHLLLRAMPDTLSKNYVDYGHECIQERMSVKLNQWGQRFSDGMEITWKTLPLYKQKINLTSHRGKTETYQLSAQIRERFAVCAESNHGFEYRFLVRSLEVQNGK